MENGSGCNLRIFRSKLTFHLEPGLEEDINMLSQIFLLHFLYRYSSFFRFFHFLQYFLVKNFCSEFAHFFFGIKNFNDFVLGFYDFFDICRQTKLWPQK